MSRGQSRPPAPSHQVSRLLLLIMQLDRGRPLTLHELAEGIPAYAQLLRPAEREDDHTRSANDANKDLRDMVENDLRALHRLGVQVRISGQPGEPTTYAAPSLKLDLPPVTLDDHELTALAIAVRNLGNGTTGVHARLSATTVARAATGRLDPLEDDGATEVTAGVDLHLDAAALIAAAVAERTPVQLQYRGDDGSERTVMLDPWGMVRAWGRTYVVGHDRDEQRPRTLRASGIVRSSVKAATAPKERPFVALPAGTTLEEHVYEVVPERTAEMLVHHRCQATLAREFSGAALAPVQPDTPGWIRLAVPFHATESTAGALRRYGPGVVVEAPDDLRRAVADGLAAVQPIVDRLLAGAR